MDRIAFARERFGAVFGGVLRSARPTVLKKKTLHFFPPPKKEI
jgi:hypothetical protein